MSRQKKNTIFAKEKILVKPVPDSRQRRPHRRIYYYYYVENAKKKKKKKHAFDESRPVDAPSRFIIIYGKATRVYGRQKIYITYTNCIPYYIVLP